MGEIVVIVIFFGFYVVFCFGLGLYFVVMEVWCCIFVIMFIIDKVFGIFIGRLLFLG